MTNQLIKEKIKEFRLKAPHSLNHKTISDIEDFLKTSLNEVVEATKKEAYEHERQRRKNEKCKTAEINYEVGKLAREKEILEGIEKLKIATQEETGSYKYDSCYEDIKKIIKDR
jgi:hypothetical protein